MSVAEHYNRRPDQTRHQRNASPIRVLRGFNNWLKSTLIQQLAKPKQRVLDLCGGKGGDLGKWVRVDASEYVLVDIATTSVQQARKRYKPQRMQAKFLVGDCFAPNLLPTRSASFDNVSCQFALHYSFESLQRAQHALANVARLLKPGGTFVCTVPDWRVLSQKRKQHGLTFGNTVYTVVFDQTNTKRYTFHLTDAIDGCVEYAIPLPKLRRLAASLGLDLVSGANFHHFYQRHGQTKEARSLMQRMGAFDAQGTIPSDQWETIGLYACYVFQKNPHVPISS